jgi:hypothetical protein
LLTTCSAPDEDSRCPLFLLKNSGASQAVHHVCTRVFDRKMHIRQINEFVKPGDKMALRESTGDIHLGSIGLGFDVSQVDNHNLTITSPGDF